MLGMKEPRFVVGFTGPEIDVAIAQREADGRVTTGDSLIRRNREWLDKGLVDIHASIEIPKGERHPRFAQVPELETFAKSDRERKMVEMFRAFRIAGQNFFLPPGVPKERVQMLIEAMRKTLSDPEFMKEYQKLSGETPSPLAAEALEKVVRELPRDANVVELFNKLAAPSHCRGGEDANSSRVRGDGARKFRFHHEGTKSTKVGEIILRNLCAFVVNSNP
jgi:hypothetical protein